MTNFMLLDLFGSALALLAWAAVQISQGYLIGFFSNALSFRAKTLGTQLQLSMMLAVGVMPVLNHLCASAFGVDAIAKISMATSAIFLIVLIKIHRKLRELLKIERKLKLSAGAISLGITAWCLVAFLMIADVQIGNSLYFPSTAGDFLKHISIADAICRTGVPPTNPMFYPGHPQVLFYYYFWHLEAAMIAKIIGTPFDARSAVIGGAIWTSLVLVAATAFCARYFRFVKNTGKSIALFAMLFLLVGNMYVLVALPLNLLAMMANIENLPSIIACSFDTIFPFTTSTYWVPHHIAAFVAMLTCMFLYMEASKTKFSGKWFIHILLAGLCAASTLGQSVYLAFALAATFAGWLFLSALRKSNLSIISMFAVGGLGLAFAFPIIREIVHANHQKGFPLKLAVKYLDPLPQLFVQQQGILYLLLQIVYFPFSFIYSMGFVLAATIQYWRLRFKEKITEREQFLITMFTVCLVLSTFVRSTVVGNDFGWRVVIPALFACILWAANYMLMIGKAEYPKAKMTPLLKGLIAIGVLTCGADLYLTRVASASFGGTALYDLRAVYAELNRRTKIDAVVQHNPGGKMIGGLYAHRQAAASDERNGYCFGPTKEEYKPVANEIESMFSPGLTLEQVKNICAKYHIDVLVIKNTDAIWKDKTSPIWSLPVAAERPLSKALMINSSAFIH